MSTVAPPIVALCRAVPEEFADDEELAEAGELAELPDPAVEVPPHAAAMSATAANPAGAHHRLRIA
ncbi:MAG TPA: hypothetical protein VMV92_03435 [Streptosporangiaceae bacterium]|nr:hypothetical protein [Streptosporangiaceae bacterium]